jgi:hypothetical protein
MQGIEWVLTLIANRSFINFLQGLYILCNKVLYFSNILYICSEMATSINIDIPQNRIKEVIEERGIKQTWFAERLGKSFYIVNSYVCNRR